jgi:addiction module RelE/StbE family toxin
MMPKTEAITARVEPKLKARAERILDELGLDANDAIRVFYKARHRDHALTGNSKGFRNCHIRPDCVMIY